MNLRTKKILAGKVGKCSPKRIIFNQDRLDEISKAITKIDMKNLIEDNAIIVKHKRGISRSRIRKHNLQKKKGRMSGHGRRKGKATARLPSKTVWINKIRTQRKLLKELTENNIVDRKTFRMLYRKAAGGFFRSKNHIKLYISEHNLANKKEQ